MAVKSSNPPLLSLQHHLHGTVLHYLWRHGCPDHGECALLVVKHVATTSHPPLFPLPSTAFRAPSAGRRDAGHEGAVPIGREGVTYGLA